MVFISLVFFRLRNVENKSTKMNDSEDYQTIIPRFQHAAGEKVCLLPSSVTTVLLHCSQDDP